MTDDYYATLGVSKTASIDEIKSSYRKLARDNHPDRLEPHLKAEGEAKFKRILEAYQVLSDPAKRKIYDLHGKDGLDDDHDSSSFEQPANFPDISNIMRGVFGSGSVFGNVGVFGGGGFPFGASFTGGHPQSNPSESQIRLMLPLEVFYLGSTINITHKRKSNCAHCQGTGSQDGENHDCAQCKGTGMIRQIRGNAAFRQVTETPCAFCSGKGHTDGWKACDTCSGQRVSEESVPLIIKIPRGASPGQTVRLAEQGSVRPGTAKRFDVVVQLAPSPDPSKTGIWRDGTKSDDLRTKVTLDLAEALCGWRKVITHLDGRSVEVVCGDVCAPGSEVVVSNEGMLSETGIPKGNLIIEVEVTFPDHVGNRQALWSLLSRDPYRERKTPDNVWVKQAEGD
jgi:DnaJ-class molecular chaperone